MLSYVTATLDLADGQGNYLTQGTAALAPSAVLTDSADHLIAGTLPVPVPFRAGATPPSIKLIATDTPGVLPSGWAWVITPPTASGIAPFSFFLPAGNAAFTATNAAPAIFTVTGSSYVNGTSVTLSGGSLPAGFSAATTYYIVGASGSTFQLSATLGGSPIASTSTGSGTVTTTGLYLSALSPVSTFAAMQAYMPLPSGTPASGQAPVATGVGETSAWTYVAALAGDLGGTPASPTVISTHLGAPLPPNQGGTGAATQQAAIDALAGSQAAGQYLRGTGTHVQMSAIQAGDLPDLAYVDTVTAADSSVTIAGTADNLTVASVPAAIAQRIFFN